MPDINYLAVLVAAVVAIVVGGIWYGRLFAKPWMEGMGWDLNDRAQMDKMKKAAGPAYVQQAIDALLMSFVMAHVIWAFQAAGMQGSTGVIGGIQAGFWLWLGLVLPVKYSDKLWGGKKFKYVAIDLAYYLVRLILMGLILSLWR